MLETAAMAPTIPVTDMDRAKAFYRDKLGLRLVKESAGGTMLQAGGGTVAVLYPRTAPTKADHTVARFLVADVEAAVRDLRSAGLAFEDYDLPGLKTVDGVATSGGIKAAWFKDPEGNILAVADF